MPKISASSNEIANAVIATVLLVQVIHKVHPTILKRDLINDMRKCLALVDSFSSGIFYCLFNFLIIDLKNAFCFLSFLIIRKDSRVILT